MALRDDEALMTFRIPRDDPRFADLYAACVREITERGWRVVEQSTNDAGCPVYLLRKGAWN